MMINKLKLLKIFLNLGALYYLIGAVVHYFGLTLFPFYDGKLYTPYHDSIIALVALLISLFLIIVSKNPVKNIDMLKLIIFGVILASIVSIAIIWKVDFAAIGAPAKKIQTITEGIIGFIFAGLLIWLYPRES